MAHTAPWTRDRVLALPEDGNRYELINGELLVSAGRTYDRHSPAIGWSIPSRKDHTPDTTDTPRLPPRFDHAVALALRLHRRQLRKGTDIPYASHLLAVTALVIEHGGSEDQAIAAVLHDAVEDQGGQDTLTLIRDAFGAEVATLVAALSDTDVEPKPAWRPRKEAYIAHVAGMPEGAVLVALADKVHNARAIVRDVRRHGDRVWGRFNADRPEDVPWYYRELARALRARTSRPLLEHLEEAVMAMASLWNNPGLSRL